MSSPLRIGYVPEHFSTPLHFAAKHFSLNATLIPYPSGTGHMITALKSHELDVAIGLTEGFVTALGNRGAEAGFKLVGTYVETPLCWAVSTGANSELRDVNMLEGKKIGVSRIGSGSYVMGFVMADKFNWLKATGEPPFPVIPLQTFANLRQAVNDGTADFFMWEHFTSKRYFDNGEIVRIGEIYTPWSSWKIVAAAPILEAPAADDERLQHLFAKLNQGVQYFWSHQDEAVAYISSNLDYSEEDAREWLKTVRFTNDVRGVHEGTIEKTVDVLKKAGVVGNQKEVKPRDMIGLLQDE